MKNALNAKIHIAKKELLLDNDVYRDILFQITGETSCSKMSDQQKRDVLDHFKKMGFVPRTVAKKRMSPPSSEKVKAPEIRKIRAIWITMHKHGFVRDNSENALDSYVKRMTVKLNQGKGVEAVTWLDSALASKVLEALKAWHSRSMLQKFSTKGITRDELGNPLYKKGYQSLLDTFENHLLKGGL